MSAFVCSNRHFNALAAYLAGKPGTTVDSVQKALACWLGENLRSVDYLYGEECFANFIVYWKDLIASLDPAYPAPSHEEAVKLLSCLDYQSCEHPAYEASESCKLIQELQAYAPSQIDYIRPIPDEDRYKAFQQTKAWLSGPWAI